MSFQDASDTLQFFRDLNNQACSKPCPLIHAYESLLRVNDRKGLHIPLSHTLQICHQSCVKRKQLSAHILTLDRGVILHHPACGVFGIRV